MNYSKKKLGKNKNKTEKKMKKLKRRARGYEEDMNIVIAQMLNKTHKKTYGTEFQDDDLVKKILYQTPARAKLLREYKKFVDDKAKEKARLTLQLKENLINIEKINSQIKDLEFKSQNGPSRRTRSKGLHNQNSEVVKLQKEQKKTQDIITSIKWSLDRMERLTKKPK